MALAYLLSTGDIHFDPQGKIFVGELSLDGSLRRMKGVLSLVIGAKDRGIKEIYIPHHNMDEASVIDGISIFPVKDLKEIIRHLDTTKGSVKIAIPVVEPSPLHLEKRKIEVDFQEVKGQESAKRALEIAASGRHNIMMYGPPGTGKTMLAKAFASILPELSFEEMLEVTTIHSSSTLAPGIISHPPFRSPHHSASYISIVGGGSYPKPGEVTLAHRGVLFMDEFPEFDIRVIDSLRQPLEDKRVRISRAKTSVVFPSDFILLASMNPCPCGYKGSPVKECICTYASIARYQRKISGPIIDRIDMWVEVSEVDYEKLGRGGLGESTEVIQKRVKNTKDFQSKGGLSLSESCRNLINTSASALHLSARMYNKVIMLARTIADLDQAHNIEEKHILEALQYRPKL